MKAEIIKKIFEEHEQRHGYTNPAAVAHALKQDVHIPYQDAMRRISRMDTAPFLYTGAKETLTHLIQYGDAIIAWTQGDPYSQLWKIRNAGLGELRQITPRISSTEPKQRFSVMAHLDKLAILPEILNRLSEKGTPGIAIVDDKASNIAKASHVVTDFSRKDKLPPVYPIWINQGRTQGVVPQGYTVETFCKQFKTVTDIRQLPTLRKELALPPGTTWLIDVDHTLIHTAAAKEKMFQQLAGMIPQ